MAEASKTEELEVTWDLLDCCNGFSFDMGGSAFKLLYISKENWIEPKDRKKESKAKLSKNLFSNSEVEAGEAREFVKDRVYIRRQADSDKPPVVYGTGAHASFLKGKLSQDFGVSVVPVTEMDCFVHALQYLIQNVPRCDVIRTVKSQDIQESRSNNEFNLDMMKSIASTFEAKLYLDINEWNPWFVEETKDASKPFIADDDIYPCILVLCGSGWGTFCVYEEEAYEAVTLSSSRSGKMWLGLGSLLTGGNGYSELMSLAEKGSAEAVDICLSDLLGGVTQDTTDDDSMYKFVGEAKKQQTKTSNRTIFAFAKAENKTLGDFKKEDLAVALLHTMVSDLVQLSHDAARIKQAKHVFFSGGFVESDLVRTSLYKQWKNADCNVRIFDGTGPIECHFLKHGQYIGALGALLRHQAPSHAQQ